MWDLSCKDWQARLIARQSLIPDLPDIDQTEAAMAVAFFDALRIPDVPGLPLMRDACGQWWKDIVWTLFGAWHPGEGKRYIEEVFALVPKKSSKTTYGAGLMLTALLMNRRPRTEFLFVGPTQAISDLAYSQAVGMIEAEPQLQQRFQTRDHVKEIVDRNYRAKLKIKTCDLDILTGPRPAGVMLDELHLLGRHRDAAKIIRQLRGGRQATPEGFMVFTTTQSDEPPAGAFRDELMTARAIRDGKLEGVMLPVLYEFPESIAKDREKILDTVNWPMIMPNLGRSQSLERLMQDFAVERTKGEQAIIIWASQHLNVEIGLALGSDAWVGASYWQAAAEEGLTLESIKERSDICVVGIDGGGLDDLLGLVVLGRDRDTRDWLCWAHAWAHESVFERRKDIVPTLRDFEADGDLTVVATVGDDVTGVADIVEELEALKLLPQKLAIGVDQAGIFEIVNGISLRNIDASRIGGVPQGWKLTNSIKSAERRLAGKTMRHCGQRLMAWNVGNARVEPRGNAITITKQTAGSAKIDCLMALFDAVVAMGLNPDSGPSMYEFTGLRTI